MPRVLTLIPTGRGLPRTKLGTRLYTSSANSTVGHPLYVITPYGDFNCLGMLTVNQNNSDMLTEFCFSMIGRADIKGLKINAAFTWSALGSQSCDVIHLLACVQEWSGFMSLLSLWLTPSRIMTSLFMIRFLLVTNSCSCRRVRAARLKNI